MKQIKLLKIVIAILVILNIALSAMLYLGHKKNSIKRSAPRRHARVENFLKKKLNLNDQQAAAFNEERKGHFQKTRNLMRSIAEDRREASKLLYNQKVDSTAINDYLNAISVKNTQLEKLNLYHLKKLRQICNERQKAQFDRIIIKMMERQERDRDIRERNDQKPRIGE